MSCTLTASSLFQEIEFLSKVDCSSASPSISQLCVEFQSNMEKYLRDQTSTAEDVIQFIAEVRILNIADD